MDDHRIIPASAPIQAESRMHPVVRAAMAQAPSPETLRELLAVQREWEAGEARRAYTRALVALKRDLPSVIARDQTVAFSGTRYTHASLGAAVEAVTPALTQHGFAATWHPSTSERLVTVACRLTHEDGHCEECSMSAPPDSGGKKSPQQGIASTVTLLSRYTLLSLLGIATADMKDPEPQQGREGEVNPQRNSRAAARLRELGLSVYGAEEHVGRSMVDWTSGDLAAIAQWAEGRKEAK